MWENCDGKTRVDSSTVAPSKGVSVVTSTDQHQLPTAREIRQTTRVGSSSTPRQPTSSPPKRASPILWRVFAANALVFALAFALLALSPITIHARIRLVELMLLLAGLAVMLVADLLLLRQLLRPLQRLTQVMRTIDLLRPGQRARGFERASRETQALASAFNEMLMRLEDERRESSTQVLAAQEAERLRIARELHDEVGQTLTAVALRADHAAEQGSGTSELGDLVRDALEEVRRISRELRPEALDDLGLLNALIALCSRISEQTGLQLHRQLKGPLPDLPADVVLAIYRIAQEALTNVMRHSEASSVEVSLIYGHGSLTLSVKDDGRGLPERVSEAGGLSGMRERAMLIGAELRICSAPGQGVEVVVRLPIEDERT